MKITYQVKHDPEHKIDVQYYLTVDFVAKVLTWIIYPPAPKEMYFKHADMLGLGYEHDQGEQTFEEFKTAPKEEISDNAHEIVSFILGGESNVYLEIDALKKAHPGIKVERKDNFSNFVFEVKANATEPILFSIEKSENFRTLERFSEEF